MTIKFYTSFLFLFGCLPLIASDDIEVSALKVKVKNLEEKVEAMEQLLNNRRAEGKSPKMQGENQRRTSPHSGRFDKPGGQNSPIPDLMHKVRKQFLEKNDIDKDGKLSMSEKEIAKANLRKAFQTKLKLVLEKYDVDKDGVLSMKEKHSYAKFRRTEFMSNFDENSNGIFENEEKKKAFKHLLENDPTEILLLHNLKIHDRTSSKQRASKHRDRSSETNPSHRDRE